MQNNATNQGFEGRYSRLGSKLRLNDSKDFYLVVAQRKKVQDYRKGKPPFYLVAHGKGFPKRGKYISSLYQRGHNRFKFDFNRQVYSMLLTSTDAEIRRIN